MRSVTVDFRTGSISTREAVADLSANSSALEGMPHAFTRESPNLVIHLEDEMRVQLLISCDDGKS